MIGNLGRRKAYWTLALVFDSTPPFISSAAERWRSAASRACSPWLSPGGCGAARRLERLVRQPALSADGSRRVEHPTKCFVDRIVRRKSRRDFRVEQDQVASLAKPRDVLATDAALHRRKVVLRSQVVIVVSICLVHRTLARASSLDGADDADGVVSLRVGHNQDVSPRGCTDCQKTGLPL